MTIASVEPAAARKLVPPTVVAPPAPLPLWRFLPAFVRNPLRAVSIQCYEDDILVVNRGGVSIAWVSSPALVEKVLLDDAARVGKSAVEKRVFGPSLAGSILVSDGADWRWQRRLLAPLFRPADIQAYVPAMAAAGEALVARWRQAGNGTRAIDDDMLRVTYDVILATMLVGGRPAEAETILRAGNDYLARVSWEIAFGILRVPAWVPHPATRQMRRAAARMRAAVAAIIARRKVEGGSPVDLLGRLLAARHPDTGAPMSDDLLVSNLLTLLEAGHETTAKALTWTLYLLARAPEWQQGIRDEVAAVAGGRPIEAADVPKLVITERVIKEALRLYPSAPVMGRDPKVPIELGGHHLGPGSQIVIPIFAIHRHRKLWHEPDAFDPDRFLPEAEAKRPRTQYMPFGAGPRICIGAAFAMMEATVLLATFVRGATFGWDGKHLPEPVSRVTLRPAGGMPLAVRATVRGRIETIP